MSEPESVYCDVCQYVLDVVVSTEGVTYTHPYGLKTDHQPQPVRYVDNPRLRCDFCTSEEVRWSFFCDPYNTSTDVANETYDSRWAACDPCAELVERRNLRGLIERAIDSLPAWVVRGRKNAVRESYNDVYTHIFKTLRGREAIRRS